LSLLFSWPVSFMPGSVLRKLRTNSDLGHAVYQALTGDKLHKTNIKDTTGLTRRPARVKGIGPRMSKVSDSHDKFRRSFYDRG
jgi:hypothetical protein